MIQVPHKTSALHSKQEGWGFCHFFEVPTAVWYALYPIGLVGCSLGPSTIFSPPSLKMSSISCAAVPVVRVEGGDSIGRSYAKKVGVASVLHCAS